MLSSYCALCGVLLLTPATVDSLSLFYGRKASPGCASHLGLQLTASLSACHGDWSGHVETANALCAEDYSVCSYHDAEKLKSLTWSQVTQTPGCYAYNAAQDGHTCRACEVGSTEADDLAGVGSSCPHVNQAWTGGCLSDGLISASCCIDSINGRACQQQPWISGVLCCRREDDDILNGTTGDSIAQKSITAVPGESVELMCPSKEALHVDEKLQWEFMGRPVHSINSVIWVIPRATEQNSGIYSCRKQSEASVTLGMLNLTIESGHISRGGKRLCARDWRVCTVRDVGLVRQIAGHRLDHGCFAYNAAQIGSRCQRCRGRGVVMAALGRSCPVVRPGPDACSLLSNSTAAFKPLRVPHFGCHYASGVQLTGVLCCEKRRNKTKRNRGGNN